MDSEIVKWILALSGFLVAFGVIWKFVRYVFRVDKAMPVLLQISEQFVTNGGSTMLDKINKLVENQAEHMGLLQGHINDAGRIREELTIENKVVLKIAEDSKLVAQTNAAIVNELAQAQTADAQHIKEYLHEKMHEINNSIAVTQLQNKLADKHRDRIEKRLDDIIPYVQRHREDYENNESE